MNPNPWEISFLRRSCLPEPVNPLSKSKPDNLRWDRIIHYAVRQGLAPLLWYRLTESDQGCSALVSALTRFPDPEIDQALLIMLRNSYLSTLKRNLHIQGALKELDQAVSNTDITCIIWKGAALAADVYPAMGLRPMDDIDILLPHEHFEPFKSVLARLGYLPRPCFPLTWQRNDTVLDLHPDIVHSDRISTRLKALSLTAEDLVPGISPLAGFQHLVTLSPCDALICLAIHTLKHGFSRDIWMADTFYILNRFPEISAHPEYLVQRSLRTGALFPLSLLCTVAGSCYSQDDPLMLCFCLRKPDMFSRIIRKAVKHGLHLPHIGELAYLFMIRSFQDKLKFLKETMFPGQKVMYQLFPDKNQRCPRFYYPHRIARLAKMGAELSKTLIALWKM